jgi:Family of unknown function (DUF1028)
MRNGTCSVVASDAPTGELGVAVLSHWFGVGAVVPWAIPGVGAGAAPLAELRRIVRLARDPAWMTLLERLPPELAPAAADARGAIR